MSQLPSPHKKHQCRPTSLVEAQAKVNDKFLGVSEAHLYETGFKHLSFKIVGKEDRGGVCKWGTGREGLQSESGPSLLNIGFLWREVDCPFLDFEGLE